MKQRSSLAHTVFTLWLFWLFLFIVARAWLIAPSYVLSCPLVCCRADQSAGSPGWQALYLFLLSVSWNAYITCYFLLSLTPGNDSWPFSHLELLWAHFWIGARVVRTRLRFGFTGARNWILDFASCTLTFVIRMTTWRCETQSLPIYCPVNFSKIFAKL